MEKTGKRTKKRAIRPFFYKKHTLSLKIKHHQVRLYQPSQHRLTRR